MAETSGHGPFRLRYAAVSDVGRHRKENQDSGYASEHLLVIADGVGGAAYGDVASSTAVHLLRRLDATPSEDMLGALAGAVHRIHDKLAEMVEQDPELDGTSTTVTAALFDGRRLGFVHVGDSRAYHLHDERLQQLTKDHTFVQTLVDEGRITEEDSRIHPHRNIILRAVDGIHDTEPDLFEVQLEPGDRVMLCSDGCSGAVTDAEMEALLREGTVDSAALGLVQAALDGGTTDNVTVVVAEVVPVDSVDDPETSAAAAVGPMLVGAAADQPRRGGTPGRSLFRHRQGDTGELEPVPAAPEVDPEELRYAPQPPHRHAGLRRAFMMLVPLVLVGLVLTAAYSWSQNQYFVKADGENVVIYRGVDTDIPGIRLSSVYERHDDLQVAALSPFNQEKVTQGIVADDAAAAQRIVDGLADQAAECASPRPAPSPSSTPTATPSPSPTRTPEKPGGSGNGAGTGSGDKAGAAQGAGTPSPTRSPDSSPSPTESPAPSPSGTEGDPGAGSQAGDCDQSSTGSAG